MNIAIYFKGLWFDTHIIVIMTIFSQPQFKQWPGFVPQSVIVQLVSFRTVVHVVGFDIPSVIGTVPNQGCAVQYYMPMLISYVFYFSVCMSTIILSD